MSRSMIIAERSRILVFPGDITSGKPLAGASPVSSPGGFVTAEDGLLLAVDQAQHQLAVLSLLTATWSTHFGAGSGAGQLSRPSDVTVDAQGRALVVDRGNRRIVRCDVDGGGWVTFGAAGAGVGEFTDPTSVAFDGAGRIVVADPGARRVVRVDDMEGSGWQVVALPGPAAGMGSFPMSVTAVGPDRWAVSDVGARQVYLLTLDDSVVATLPTADRLPMPTYVAGRTGELIVGDPAVNEVQRFGVDDGTLTLTQRWRGSDPGLPAPVFEQLAGVGTLGSERA